MTCFYSLLIDVGYDISKHITQVRKKLYYTDWNSLKMLRSTNVGIFVSFPFHISNFSSTTKCRLIWVGIIHSNLHGSVQSQKIILIRRFHCQWTKQFMEISNGFINKYHKVILLKHIPSSFEFISRSKRNRNIKRQYSNSYN